MGVGAAFGLLFGLWVAAVQQPSSLNDPSGDYLHDDAAKRAPAAVTVGLPGSAGKHSTPN